jgi:transcriptional regulator with XRE-family HTH domain
MNIERLKEIREDKDYKQMEIAKYLKVTQAQYSRYEMGINTIPIEKIALLAKLYDTSIDYLMGLTDERKPYPRRKI